MQNNIACFSITNIPLAAIIIVILQELYFSGLKLFSCEGQINIINHNCKVFLRKV